MLFFSYSLSLSVTHCSSTPVLKLPLFVRHLLITHHAIDRLIPSMIHIALYFHLHRTIFHNHITFTIFSHFCVKFQVYCTRLLICFLSYHTYSLFQQLPLLHILLSLFFIHLLLLLMFRRFSLMRDSKNLPRGEVPHAHMF